MAKEVGGWAQLGVHLIQHPPSQNPAGTDPAFQKGNQPMPSFLDL